MRGATRPVTRGNYIMGGVNQIIYPSGAKEHCKGGLKLITGHYIIIVYINPGGAMRLVNHHPRVG